MSIEKKCLIPPSPSDGAFFVQFIPLIGVFGTLVAASAIGIAGFIIGALATLFLVLVASGLASMIGSIFRENMGHTADRKLREHIGKDPIYIDIDGYFIGTTVYTNGIAFDGTRFHILSKGYIASFDWSDIRSWQWNIEGYETTQLYGKHTTGTRVGVNANNRKAANLAFQGSGFFVEIADIDDPVWHYVSVNKKTLERWTEIFAQVNEGRIKIAA